METKKLDLQEKSEKLVSLHILHNLCLTADKEIKENPDLLLEAKNYYPVNESGLKDDENGNYPEIMEFWAVDEWLFNKLEAKGEVVFEMLDFKVWGRQTTGQAIKLDFVVEEIAKEEMF